MYSDKVDQAQAAPMVSIVIPTYNREELVMDTIDSALSQTYPNFEVVLADNCSTDETLQKIRARYIGADLRIVVQDVTVAPPINWLAGLNEAKGEYVKILFSDDLIVCDAVANMVSLMNDCTGYVMSSCLIGELPWSGSIFYRLKWLIGNAGSAMIDSRIGLLLHCIRVGMVRSFLLPSSPCAALFRRKDLIRWLEESILKPACPEVVETGAGCDVECYLKALCEYNKFGFFAAPQVFFRSHPGSITIAEKGRKVKKAYDLTFARFFIQRGGMLKLLAISRVKLLEVVSVLLKIKLKVLRLKVSQRTE